MPFASTSLNAAAAAQPPGQYHAITPTRVLDSRDGTGGFSTPFAGGQRRDVKIAGMGGVPADSTAVVINVTATDTAADGFLSVFPAGGVHPITSSLQWVPGQTVPNLVTVGLGNNGSVSI